MTQDEIFVPAISCDHCKRAIEGAVAALAGVESVAVDIAGKRVSVSFDAAVTDQGAIVTAIEAAGYEVPQAAGSTSGGS